MTDNTPTTKQEEGGLEPCPTCGALPCDQVNTPATPPHNEDGLRKALERIAEGDEPRPLGEQWRNDGKPSKNDKCIHARWMYEDCGQCIAEFARQALGDIPSG